MCFMSWGSLKNWVWNVVFVQQFLHVFLTEFRKNLFVLAFQKHFWKILNLFFLLQINIFLMFSDHFDALILKIIL